MSRIVAVLLALVASAALAQSPARSFEALADGGTVIPPGTQGAAGPSHLVAVTNAQVRVQTKNGATVSTTTLDTFMNGTNVFAPRIVYDAAGGRWIVVALEGESSADSYVLLAVSNTSDPTGLWTRHRFLADLGELGAGGDFPTIGYSDDFVALNVNLFIGDTFAMSQIIVLDKADLYAGDVGDPVFYLVPEFNVVPAVSMSATSPVYLVAAHANNALVVYSATDTALVDHGLVTGTPWSQFGGNLAPQLGTATKIDLGDDRILSAVYRNGFVYAAHNAFFPAAGPPTHSAAQWWKISTDLATVSQITIRDATGATSYGYPSIAVNSRDEVLAGFSIFSGSQYAGAAYSLRRPLDPAGSYGAPVTYKAGLAPYVKTFGGGDNRWGDASATCVDPSNGVDFWTVQEYAAAPSAGSDRWGTWWANVVPPVLAAPANLIATATSASSVALTWNTVAGATQYEVARSFNNGAYATIATVGTNAFTDTTAAADTTYLYKVRAIGSDYSNVDFATTVVFTDASLTGVVAKQVHITQLRTAVNALRASAGLASFAFTDPTPITIRTVHITELRTALNAARTALGASAITFTDTPPVIVKAVHVTQLRSGTQ